MPNLKINEIKCNTLAKNLASSVDQKGSFFCSNNTIWTLIFKLGNCAISNNFLAFMYIQIVYWQGTLIKVRS